MTAAGFPGSAKHAAIHHQLLARAVQLGGRYRAGNLDIGELFQFLACDLVARHRPGADGDCFPYLAGVSAPLANSHGSSRTPVSVNRDRYGRVPDPKKPGICCGEFRRTAVGCRSCPSQQAIGLSAVSARCISTVSLPRLSTTRVSGRPPALPGDGYYPRHRDRPTGVLPYSMQHRPASPSLRS